MLQKKKEKDLDSRTEGGVKRVFCYGTLKSGHHNNYLLEGRAEKLGTFHTKGEYWMTNVGFPYVTPKGITGQGKYLPVMGEVWEFEDENVLRDLDCLEGEGYHYHRREIEVAGIVGKVSAYLQLDPSLTARGYEVREENGCHCF